MSTQKKTVAELQAELEAIIEWFESDEADIDKASVEYERGLKIAKELKARLQVAENKIVKLKQEFSEEQS